MKYEFRVELYFSTRCGGNGWTERTKEFDTKEELIDWCVRWDAWEVYEDIKKWIDDQEEGCVITDNRNAQGFEITETQIY